jgi:hypothetical protein
LSRRYFFTLWLYMPRHPTLGMATPSIILIPVVEGIGPCPPACDRQSPAPPPSTTFACTHRDAPGRSHFASDPCLSLRLYELDEPPFFLRFRLVQIAQNLLLSFVSIAHTWRLGTLDLFWRDKRFRRLSLALHSLCV